MDKYSWSFDGDAERWYESAGSISECLAEAKAAIARGDAEPAATVYIGINVPFIPSVDAESVLESIEEQAYEFCELGEDWCACDARKDELEELSDTLSSSVKAWLKKYGREPDFYAVQNIKPYALYTEKKVEEK